MGVKNGPYEYESEDKENACGNRPKVSNNVLSPVTADRTSLNLLFKYSSGAN